MRARTLSFASIFVAVACGNSAPQVKDFGDPPDAAIFNPGRSASDGYGSGGSYTPGPPVCPDEFKACNHEFTYPAGSESSVELRGDWGGADTWQAGAPMQKSSGAWRATVPVPFGKPVQYKFLVNGTQWVFDPAQPTVTDPQSNTNNTFAGKTCEPALCTEPGALPPGVFDWRDAVIYFVFVDRFFDGNPSLNAACQVSNVSGGAGSIANYQGGDWAGVTAKINEGYFSDVGANVLWLTVPMKNPNVSGAGIGGDTHTYSAYHGYWPSEPEQPEECFGSMNDLRALVDAAHAKGIKVIFDYAMVHVHDSAGVYAQHRDWFWPNDNGRGGNCICGSGCSWDALPDRERCWFADYLPHWNYTNAAARAYNVNVALSWIKDTGVDGFRLDAIKHVDMSWLTDLRARVNAEITATQTPRQRFYMVGETYDFSDRNILKAYVDPNTKMDGQFDFPLRRHVVEATMIRTMPMSDLAAFMDSNDYFYGGNAIMSPFIGNHDLPRVIHLAANSRLWGESQAADGKDRAWSQPGVGLPAEREAFERVANGFAVLFTNRGAPLVYYGDEIGMPGAGDPDNRRFMQWSGVNANQTWLRDRVKKLLSVRAAHPALRRGSRRTLFADANVWLFTRTTSGDTVYVAINRSDDEKTVSLPGGAFQELVTGATQTGSSARIPPRQARVFLAN